MSHRERTVWLAWKDSNSETSSQIIPLKGRIDLWESSRISGHRDYSRLSCDAGDTQLGPRTKISARILRGRWSTGRYLFQLAPSGAGFFSLRIPEFESADPGILNSPVVMCANLRAPQKWVEILAAAAYSPRRSSNVKSLRCAVLAS